VPKIVKFGVIPGLLLIVLATVVVSIQLDMGSGSSPESLVIERLLPGESDKTLQQGEVGIDLLSGWTADLRINEVPIPDDELDRVTELGLITFRPGPGKAVEYLLAGQNCATATYWQIATGPEQSFTRTWCFSAV